MNSVVSVVFCKIKENVRNHINIQLITTEARNKYIVSEPNYHTTKIFSENLVAIEWKKNTDTYEETTLFMSINTGNQ